MALLLFDIGGTAVKYGIWTNDKLQHVHSFFTPSSWIEMENQLMKVYNTYKEKYDFSGVSISSPGAVDTKKGIIKGISAVPYIHEFNIINKLSTLFELPVAIENDANCAALAEVHFGAGKEVSNIVFVIIGSGIGGALVIDNNLIKGPNLFGGEFGYMLLEEGQTFSKLVSPVSVAEKYSLDFLNGQSFSGKDLFDLADSGELEANNALEKMFNYLAIGIINLSVSINPDLVLIGGGISDRSDLLERLVPKIDRLKQKIGASDLIIPISTCKFSSQANLMGAMANFNLKCADQPIE